jgi:hypothetical protein
LGLALRDRRGDRSTGLGEVIIVDVHGGPLGEGSGEVAASFEPVGGVLGQPSRQHLIEVRQLRTPIAQPW